MRRRRENCCAAQSVPFKESVKGLSPKQNETKYCANTAHVEHSYTNKHTNSHTHKSVYVQIESRGTIWGSRVTFALLITCTKKSIFIMDAFLSVKNTTVRCFSLLKAPTESPENSKCHINACGRRNLVPTSCSAERLCAACSPVGAKPFSSSDICGPK